MSYTWQPAELFEIDGLLEITREYYLKELEGVLTIDLDKLAENISHAIVKQKFNPGRELLQTIKNENCYIVGWSWLGRGGSTDYVKEEVAEAHMLHLDLSLSARDRIRLVNGTLDQWIDWCRILKIPVLASTTVREDYQGFMKLHERRGFLVRGSHAFYDVRREPDYV